jgi:hypothetical protein
MDEFVGELIAQLFLQIFSLFGAAALELLARWVLWLVAGGVRTAWWLAWQGVHNGLCFYRDLWLRMRWRMRRLRRA